MPKQLLFFLVCCSLSVSAPAQSLVQYFDGADTSATYSLKVVRDTAAGNIWQIGKPQKTTFKAAFTAPHALVTDTLLPYPTRDSSRFSITVRGTQVYSNYAIAFRWAQRLDLDTGRDGGIVEFSKNGGPWQNVFNNPNVYNLYGYNQTNKDTLANGTYAFSGTDTVWRDIWFCLSKNFFGTNDTVTLRFTLKTDSIADNRDGWIIDNMRVAGTFVHTVGKTETGHDAKVYPTRTTGTLFLEADHRDRQHVITDIRILDAAGKEVQHYRDQQQRFILDISHLPPGPYFVKVTTNLGGETVPIVLQP